MASIKTWGDVWKPAVPPPSAAQPPYKLTPCWEPLRSGEEKVRKRKGGRRGKGGRGGWAEASSQSLELWLWEKTVTLSSQNPLDRGGILSLVPLGLEKAIEGYFLRSEAEKEWVGRERERNKRGEKDDLRRLSEFCGMWDGKWAGGKGQPKATKTQSKNKHKHGPPRQASVPPIHTAISTTKTSERHLRRLWVTVRDTQSKASAKEVLLIKHLDILMSRLLHTQPFPPSKPHRTNSYQSGVGRQRRNSVIERESTKREKAFRGSCVRGPRLDLGQAGVSSSVSIALFTETLGLRRIDL